MSQMDNRDDSDSSSEGSEVYGAGLLEGWTKEEKHRLLIAIKNFGSSDIDAIAECIETKTFGETSKAIEYYKEIALKACPKSALKTTPRRNSMQKTSFMPLANWAKLLTENVSFKDLKNETATALRLIAEYENLPEPTNEKDINLKNLYLILANAIEGKTLPNNDDRSKSVIEKCLIETALFSKSFMRNCMLEQVLDTLSLSDINDDRFHNFTEPVSDHEVAGIRHLISQTAYNPFKIDEKFLKPSTSF